MPECERAALLEAILQWVLARALVEREAIEHALTAQALTEPPSAATV